jgi:hypothetical protein
VAIRMAGLLLPFERGYWWSLHAIPAIVY